MRCLVCGGGNIEPLYTMIGFELLKCADCGLVFQNGGEAPDQSGMIREIYNEAWVRMKELAANGDLYSHYLYSSHLVNNHGSHGGRMLEIGCGTAEFLYLMKLMGWDVTGIEPSEKSCDFARQKYQLDLKNTLWDISVFDGTGKFDAVVFWHVLEHIPDPAAFLTEVSSLLSNGGKIYLSVPNNDCLDNRLLAAASPVYTERDHLYHYSIQNLPLLLSKAGLAFEEIFLWEGPGRLKSDWELYKRTAHTAGLPELKDEYAFLAWLRNNQTSHELFCVCRLQ